MTDELNSNGSFFRAMVETSSDWIWEVDRNGIFTYSSPQVEKILGYTPEEIVGKSPFELMPPEEAARIAEIFEDVVKNCKPIFNVENVNIHKDGRRIVMESSGVPICDDKGVLVCFRGVDRDITERKQMEEKLRQSEKMESIGRLAGGIAHDFNNMLCAILGHAEISISKMAPDDPQLPDLLEIQNAAQRSAELTKQLLAFARKQIITPKVLDLNEVVERMLKMMQRLIGEGIILEWNPAGDLWKLKMDSTQIDQILANLCVNARDAMNGNGKITVSTGNVSLDKSFCAKHRDAVPGDYVLLSVGDTGCGMDKKTMANLFEPFFTTKDVGKGVGMGLATVHGIVRQNGGFITVDT